MKFLVGFAIAAALGTIIAPASGDETRRWLRRKAEDALKVVGDTGTD